MSFDLYVTDVLCLKPGLYLSILCVNFSAIASASRHSSLIPLLNTYEKEIIYFAHCYDY